MNRVSEFLLKNIILREDFVAKMVANIVRMVMIKIPIHLEKKYQNNEKMLDFGTFSGISGDFV